MSNEVNGRTALAALALTASESTINDPLKSDTADTKTVAKPVRGRPFAPGNNANPRGRPKKGESFADKYRKRLEKDADALIEAHVVRAQGKGAVAARDFELAAAYAMGRPQQKYVVETQDSPLLAFLQRHTAALPYIEGEARLLPADDADVRT